MRPALPAPPPQEIAAALGKRVIGQAGAVQEMAIALSKKLAGLGVGNILMIGSSGTGKTTLMRAVEVFTEGMVTTADPLLGTAVASVAGQVLPPSVER